MKNSSFLHLSMAAIILVAVQCAPVEEPEPEPQPEPTPETTIVLNETEINAPAEGGTFTVTYSVENPSESLEISTVSGGDWVDVEPSIGEILLVVAENAETSARTDTVTVFCNEEQAGEIVVNQAGREEEPPVEYGFSISIIKADQTYVEYEIAPENKEMYYLHKAALKSVVDAYASDEELIMTDFDELQMYADMVGTPIWTLMTTQGFTKTGDYSGVQDNLAPGTDYYIYAYGVESGEGGLTVNAITDVYKEPFTTLQVEQEDAEFVITYEVESNMAYATVEPKDQNQRYYFAYEHKDSWTSDEEILAKYQQNLSSMYEMYLMVGMSAEDFFNQMTNIGTKTIEVVGLLPENTYVGFAVAINDEAIFCSDITKAEFTTLPVGDSDNRISITVTNIGEEQADFSITTTNEDPYVFFIEPASRFEGLSDDEIIQMALESISYTTSIYNGDYSGTANYLTPDTEYLAFAFGYMSGTATTGLSKADFRTSARTKADIDFSLSYDKYFDGTELAERYPEYSDGAGYAALPVEVSIDGDAASYSYAIYDGDFSDVSLFSDEDVLQQLISDPNTTVDMPSRVFFIDYDRDYTLLGFARDAQGDYSAIYRQVVRLTEDGTSPVDEFEE